MSYNTLTEQTRDEALTDRITAAVTQEAWENPGVADSSYAQAVRAGAYNAGQLVWPVCIATEDAYASALAGGVPDPGADEAVVSDGMILAAVQASWPPDPS